MALTRELARSQRRWVRTLNRAIAMLRLRSATVPLPTDGAAVRSILVTELWNIGDVVLAMPFLAELRRRFPRAEVVLVGRPHAGALLKGTGLVDEFAPFDFPWTHESRKYALWKYSPRALLRLFRHLRRKRFDLAFDCRMDARANLVLYLSGAARRIGYAFGGAEWLLTDALSITDFSKHKSQDWLGLLEPFGESSVSAYPRLVTTPEEQEWAASFLQSRGVAAGDVLVGLHPGASRAEKRWPLARFLAVAQSLAARPGARVLLLVDPSGYGRELQNRAGLVVAQPTLREMVALIERCDFVMCNDSGPMHVAAALGVPVVAVFGCGAAEWFGPMGEGHRLVSRRGSECRTSYGRCRSSVNPCLMDIGTDEVLAVVEAMLSNVSATESASTPA